MKKHVMLDLETWGNEPGSVITSIGAVRFDIDGIDDDAFYYHIDPVGSTKKYGLTVDASTIMWWLQQSEEARMEFVNAKREDLKDVLYFFSFWFVDSEYLWGNGAAFDNVLLRAAYDAVGEIPPWNWWNDRCFRTMKNQYPHMTEPEFKGTKHNALVDARHQAGWLIKIWNEVGYI